MLLLRRATWFFLYYHAGLAVGAFGTGIIIAVFMTLAVLFRLPEPITNNLIFIISIGFGICACAYLVTCPVAFICSLINRYAPSMWVAATPFMGIVVAAGTAFLWFYLPRVLAEGLQCLAVLFGMPFLFISPFIILASAQTALTELPAKFKETGGIITLGCHGKLHPVQTE